MSLLSWLVGLFAIVVLFFVALLVGWWVLAVPFILAGVVIVGIYLWSRLVGD